jgi:hypothetical protein
MSRVESATGIPATLDSKTSDARLAALEAQLKEAAVEIAELRARVREDDFSPTSRTILHTAHGE